MTRTTVLEVSGMTCGHREMSVQEALDELDGVRNVRAQHANLRQSLRAWYVEAGVPSERGDGAGDTGEACGDAGERRSG